MENTNKLNIFDKAFFFGADFLFNGFDAIKDIKDPKEETTTEYAAESESDNSHSDTSDTSKKDESEEKKSESKSVINIFRRDDSDTSKKDESDTSKEDESEEKKLESKSVINIFRDHSDTSKKDESEDKKSVINIFRRDDSDTSKEDESASTGASLFPNGVENIITVLDSELKQPTIVSEETINPITVTIDESESVVDNTSLNELLKKYSNRNKIIAATILWCCGRISSNQLEAVVNSIDKDKDVVKANIEFINTISNFFIDKLFATDHTVNEFDLDTEGIGVIRDLSVSPVLKDNSTMSLIINKLREWGAKNGKIIIVFDNNKMSLFANDAPDEMVELVEQELGSIISGYKHKISKLKGGMLELAIIRNEKCPPDTYLIDPDLVICKGLKVLIPTETDHVFLSDKEMIAKYILDKRFCLGKKYGYQMALSENQLPTQSNYAVYDLTNICDQVKKMDKTSVDKFDRKLYIVRGLLHDVYGIMPRMRVKDFKNCDSFTIVSDKDTKVMMEGQIMFIKEGLSVVVKGDDIIVTLDNETRKYSFPKLWQELITNYNQSVGNVLEYA